MARDDNTWATGLFDCCGEPGGATEHPVLEARLIRTLPGLGLCCQAWFCQCCIVGEIKQRAIGGSVAAGAALECLCNDCTCLTMARYAPAIATKSGFDEATNPDV